MKIRPYHTDIQYGRVGVPNLSDLIDDYRHTPRYYYF